MSNIVARFTASLLVASLAGTAFASGQGVGLVHSINVNTGWGGFWVQLDNPITANFEAACPQGNWAFMSINDPFFKPTLAALIAAKASGERVTIYTVGCITAGATQVPNIGAVDYGIRSGN